MTKRVRALQVVWWAGFSGLQCAWLWEAYGRWFWLWLWQSTTPTPVWVSPARHLPGM